MNFRLAAAADLPAVGRIYEDIHTAEEAGRIHTGWKRETYPVPETAAAALARGDLFVEEDGGAVVGSAIINQLQVDVYEGAAWRHAAPDGKVLVLHTLTVSPAASGRGCGTAFVRFYEALARERGCPCLRMDTNATNTAARSLYKKLGYEEIGVAPCTFNGIPGVNLILLEKYLPEAE